MRGHLWKACGCEGDPTCYACRGSGKVRDHEAEVERDEFLSDQARDDKLTERWRDAT